MRVVNCPNCGRAVEWNAASAFRPFCSERCRLLDLGEWIAGRQAIPGDEVLTSDPAQDEPATRPN